MDTPIRKYQKQKDYQRHKLFRKMKRRRRAAIEQAKDAPMKQLRRKLKIPKFEDGKDDKPNVFQLADGTFVNSHNEPLEVLDYAGVEDPTKWTYVDKKGNRYTPKATRTLTEGEQFTQRQIENEQNTRPFEFTPYIEGANEGAAAASLMMGFPFNMAGSAYYTAKASRDAYNRNYLGAVLNSLGAVTPAGSGILQSVKRLLPKEKTLITAENAANITPEQWTSAQDMAIRRGNMAEAQRLRDLHFRANAPNTKAINADGSPTRTYHTVADEYDPSFTKFNPDIEGTHSAIYTSDDPFMSGTYASKIVSEAERDHIIESTRLRELAEYSKYKDDKTRKKLADLYKVYTDRKKARKQILADHPWLSGDVQKERQKQLYVNLQNPVTINNNGSGWNHINLSDLPEDVWKNIKVDLRAGYLSDSYSTRSLEAAQMATGNYDGSIVSNVLDYGGRKGYLSEFKPGIVYQVNSPENLKLADAITYDNNGVRIPLGERDNFNIKDIRYDIPFINSLRSIAADTKKKQIISYLENAEPVPRDILRRPLSSLDEDGKVQWSVANGINDAIKFLRSRGYKTRLKNLGYTNDEANYIVDNQIDNIRKADVVTLPKYNKMYSRHGMATPYRREDGTMGYQIALQPEKSIAYNPRVTAAHEAFHVGSNRHGIKDFTSLPQDIREHNASIRPIVNDDYDAKLVFERLNDEELRTRALEVLARSERANMPVMDYINKWGADPIPGKGPGILTNPNYDHNANELRTYFTPESLKRYLEGVAGIAAPLAGGTALLGYNSLGQPIDTYKHGKDSGIHINPKNRGKFNALKKRTGKTTEQLTHSKNPLTRKRAIFALNSKKWKH